MFTLFVVMSVCLVAFVGYRVNVYLIGGKFLPSLPRKSKVDYDKIAELDAEIFGIGQPVKEFPGYKWKIQKDSHDPKDIQIQLFDGEGVNIATNWVFHSIHQPSSLEERIEKKMRIIIDSLIEERERELTIQRVMDKYNDKPVQLGS